MLPALEKLTRTLASRTAHTRLAGGLSGFIFNGHDTRRERRPTQVPILYVRIIRVVRGPHSDNPVSQDLGPNFSRALARFTISHGSSAMRASSPDEIAAARTSKSASTRSTSHSVKQMVARKRKLCHKGHRLVLNQAHLCRGFPENPP
jgi:hypothetical protein